MTRTSRVRMAIVGVASMLVVLATIQPAQTQPGFSGRPPIGFSGAGRPPGMPEPPGPGFSGRPIIPEPPRPPGFSAIGGGPGFSGAGPGIGGPGIGGPTIYEWRCGRCGRVLGSGYSPPPSAYCGACGITNRIPRPGEPNIGFDPGSGVVGGVGPGTAPPPVAPPPVTAPIPTTSPDGMAYTPASPPTPVNARGSMRWVGVAVGITLFLIIGLVVAIIVVNQQPTKPKRRPRRRVDDDDY